MKKVFAVFLICYVVAENSTLITPKSSERVIIENISSQLNEIELSISSIEEKVLNNSNIAKGEHNITYDDVNVEVDLLSNQMENLNLSNSVQKLLLNIETSDRSENDKVLMSIFTSLVDLLKSKAYDTARLANSGPLLTTLKDATRLLDLNTMIQSMAHEIQGNVDELKLQDQKASNFPDDITINRIKKIEFDMVIEGAKREKFISNLNKLNSEITIDFIEDDVEKLKKSARKRRDAFSMNKYRVAEEIGAHKTEIMQIFLPQAIKAANNITEDIHHINDVLVNRSKSVRNLTIWTDKAITDHLNHCREDLNQWENTTELILNEGDSVYLSRISKLSNVLETNLLSAELTADRIGNLASYIDGLTMIVKDKLSESAQDRLRNEQKATYVKILEERIQRYVYNLPASPKIEEFDVLLIGGIRSEGHMNSVTILAEEPSAATKSHPMPTNLMAHCAIRYEGNTFLLGGAGYNTTVVNIREGTIDWNEGDAMLDYHDFGPGCAVHNGRIWVCGGYDGFNASYTCESYSQSDGWLEEEPLINPSYSTAAVSNGDSLFIIGGTDYYGDYGIVQEYKNGNWSVHSVLPNEGTKDVSTIFINKQLYVIGGFGNENSILKFNNESHEWKYVQTLSQERVRPMLVEKNGLIWIIAGTRDCSKIDKRCREIIDIYDPVRNTVTQKRILNLPEISYGAAILVT